ncbi:4-coumarate--CoA ligase 2 [Acrodontium crateriforme]|uniref:Conserved oligomeric Golgi complex subunit 2 n=1 Tax=Acrodontium crateriforme TaxID=150365 RepID=A0AAQ3LYT9_9PEZI|nr:4-coumarate--CoA ligase 2 [Acrodontium crateriforme]
MSDDKDLAEVDGGPADTRSSLFAYLEHGLETSPYEPAAIVMHQPPDHLSEMVKASGPRGCDKPSAEHLTWTYSQLHEAAVNLAAGLLAQKIQPGSTIATFLPNGIEWLLILWAVTLAKLPLASLDYSSLQPDRTVELQALLKTSRPDLIIVPNEEAAQKVKEALLDDRDDCTKFILLESKDLNDPRTLFRIAANSESMTRDAILKNAPNDDPTRTCLILFTSGTSSGRPKGCPRSVASMTHYIATPKWGRYSAKSRFLLQSMNFRIILPTIAFAAWSVGASVVIPGPYFDPSTSLDAMEEYRITHAQFVPATTRMITSETNFAMRKLDSLEVFLICGDIVTRNNLLHAQMAFPTATVMTLYGMTEGGAWLTWPFSDTPVGQIPCIDDISPVGKIAPGARLRIWDHDSGKVAKRGQTGEIHACSAGAIRHYLDGVDEDCFYNDEYGHWFRTGDLGIIDNDGVVYIVSRLKDIVKRAGVPIAPAALENCIDEYTKAQSSVVAMPSPALGQEPFAVLASLNRKSKDQIKQCVLDHFGKDYTLAGLVSLEELGLTNWPLNATGESSRSEESGRKIRLSPAMSKFYLESASQSASSTPAAYPSDNESDDIDTLPYPAELSRTAFLANDFEPSEYLSTLRNRHQTLEDLRSDLRQRSQLVSQELLDLVNGNYEEFLSLGGDLKGGSEKVENVRVRVLGFEREVQGVRKAVVEREEAVTGLLKEKKDVRSQVVIGRALLEVGARIDELEKALGISTKTDDEEDLDSDDEDDDELDQEPATKSPQLKRLQKHSQQYILTTRLIQRIGLSHPFLQAQKPRMDEVRRTLGLDLAATLRQAKREKDADTTLAVVRLYAELGAETEGLNALKSG